MANYRYGLIQRLTKNSNSCNSISFWNIIIYFQRCNVDTICHIWLKKRKKIPSSSAFSKFYKIVNIERNYNRDMTKFSVQVNNYVAMKYANFHKRGLKGSWDKGEKLIFPVWSIFSIKYQFTRSLSIISLNCLQYGSCYKGSFINWSIFLLFTILVYSLPFITILFFIISYYRWRSW